MPLEIDAPAKVHTLINTFMVQPQRQSEVVASLRNFTERHARSLPGFVGAAVHASLDGSRVVNYVQWATAGDLQRMLATPAAQAHLAEITGLADSVQPVFYRVEFVGT